MVHEVLLQSTSLRRFSIFLLVRLFHQFVAQADLIREMSEKNIYNVQFQTREKEMFLYVQIYRSILLKDFINVWNVINMIYDVICNDIRIYCLYYKYNLQ